MRKTITVIECDMCHHAISGYSYVARVAGADQDSWGEDLDLCEGCHTYFLRCTELLSRCGQKIPYSLRPDSPEEDP